ncbi:MATE efflux family protein [Candidatus Terasakiella magnetica]|uniref:MATE efflux family protein n=1 Tax=Candidatus Terasakiella magnetica TaxID=1867952 RepID=A0A1C3RJF7_9PROT|nr:MATE family efflux transporter [Candidatus Terasakiella magnetica]SCA57391.1 MATE efflux family protein [Candidatus Terasakiella magnetica]
MASIWALALPIILSNITIPLLGAVDAAVMGHMESAAYLGAVAIGGLIFDYIYWGFGFLRLSTTGLAAQAMGAGDGAAARAVMGRATLIALVGAMVLWLVQGYIFQAAAFVIEASDEVEVLAQTYFEIRIWSAPAALMNYALMGWILACKDTKGVLIQQVITNVVNVVLDLWFVMGLGYGVEGVAVATVIAQYCGLGIGLLVLRKNMARHEGQWERARIFQLDKIKQLLSMNMDLFIRTVCLLSAFAWFTAQGAKLGDVVLAANAILLQFQQFTSYALDGFAHAVEVLSAHSVGAKKRDEFKKNVKASTQLAFVFAAGFSLIYILFDSQFIAFFTDIEEVLVMAQDYIFWVALLPLVSVWSFQLDGIYFGLTQTRILRNMMVVSLVFYIPLSLWMMQTYNNHGLWAALTIFMGLRAITLGITFPKVSQRAFQ